MSQGSKHKPTSDSKANVQALSGFGIPQPEIAAFLGISEPTLRKHYRDQLDQGATTANVKVIKSLFDNAVIHNNVAAQIFWAKVRCGWSETNIHKHTGIDGEPIEVREVSALEQITSKLSRLAAAESANRDPIGDDGDATEGSDA